MSNKPPRVFSLEFKEAIVLRIVAGERVQALADELRIKPQVLYRWWSHYDRCGVPALRGPGRPRRGQAVLQPIKVPVAVRARSARGRPRKLEPDEAAKRVAELERKLGEQALELDFFAKALRHLEASRRPSVGRGATTSSRSSTR